MYVRKIVIDGIYRGPLTPTQSLTLTWWIVTTCVLLLLSGVVLQRKFELRVESPPLTATKRKAVNWPGNEKERERGYSEHDSFPSLSARLDLNTLTQSRREKCFRPSHCWLSLSSFLFAIKCISNGTTVQKAFVIRMNSIAFNFLCNGFAIFEHSYYENCTIKTYLWIENAIQLKYCFIEN